MAIKPELRAFIVFLAGWLAVCVVVFLFASRFFHSWDGRAVSVLPTSSAEPSVYTVLIVNRDGSSVQTEWPAQSVSGLGLPVDAYAIPPASPPEDLPQTRKSRFQLHFLVERPPADGDEDAIASWEAVPTTSPRSLGIALLVFLLGAAVRNMVVSGNPLSIRRPPRWLPEGQAQAGTPAAPSKSSRARKGPPPARKRRGPRR